ncbi:hypothetical protein MSG28_010191 [Choristoneura fumiferana]|uniref:Uncharacterized protein n=1 Tax=Choristoneura fumiferana TaxID=7141 RepID=A0ACC0KK06_CHOFU|nr:hypothetical protein MSG28_010191 [Choristoneura fumiferana]
MLEVTCNDRLGKKVRVKCNPDDTVGDLKKLIAAQTGTRYDKIVLKKWYTVFKDHIKLSDYEIHDGMNLEQLHSAAVEAGQLRSTAVAFDQLRPVGGRQSAASACSRSRWNAAAADSVRSGQCELYFMGNSNDDSVVFSHVRTKAG